MSQSAVLDEASVTLRHEGAVGIVTMEYVARRNALSLGLREKLHDALAQSIADDACRILILTGAGAHFSAGGDIASMEGVSSVSGRQRLRRLQRIPRLLMESEKPVIAAVEGWAAGAGLSLATACDIVIAARNAQFVCSFGKIGLVPDLGACYSLVQRMGIGRARHMMMSGAVYTAEQAERAGVVDSLCEAGEALARAVALAQEMAGMAPLSLAMTKTLTARMPDGLDAMLKAEIEAQAVLYGSDDFYEGCSAFLEKRKPVFCGR